MKNWIFPAKIEYNVYERSYNFSFFKLFHNTKYNLLWHEKNSQSDYVITYNVVFFLCSEKLCMI